MSTIEVTTKSSPYSIICLDAFDEIKEIAHLFDRYSKILIVTDDVVSQLYLSFFEQFFHGKYPEIKILTFIVPNGEHSKKIDVAMNITSFLAENKFHRNDLILSLGGGVVGDLSGFVSSIYMRGVDLIQVPTTLLAAVDASIGGKTAIDIEQGKNLVGTFHQPIAVIEFMSIFAELKEEIFKEGVSEVIKYGAIYDSVILELLEKGARENIKEIVFRCAKAKASIVSIDETECGLRRILNFGHTYAHAIEQISNYSVSHGTAVAYGMLFEIYLSFKTGYCDESFYNRIVNLIKSYFNLKDLNYSTEQIIHYMTRDKKNMNDSIVFVLPTGQDNRIVALEQEVVADFLRTYSNFWLNS